MKMKVECVLMEKHSGSSQTLSRKSIAELAMFFSGGVLVRNSLHHFKQLCRTAVIDEEKRLVSLRFYLLLLLRACKKEKVKRSEHVGGGLRRELRACAVSRRGLGMRRGDDC